MKEFTVVLARTCLDSFHVEAESEGQAIAEAKKRAESSTWSERQDVYVDCVYQISQD